MLFFSMQGSQRFVDKMFDGHRPSSFRQVSPESTKYPYTPDCSCTLCDVERP